ncbi:MAG: extracellular solute-binding protein, partial [Treponema sp.]|nr:extracellular solute-binding protein [Treponema sp.]
MEPIAGQEPGRLKIVAPSGPGVKAIYEIAANFRRGHPGINVEISAISGMIPINAFLSSKFAVGDEPDIMIYQAGQGTRLFAQGDHLLDLSGRNFEERFILGADRYCRYNDRLYALPLDIYASGLLIQMSVLWKASIGNQDNRAIPRTLDEFVASCERLRRAGLQYPVLVDAYSEKGASDFLYQYFHQNIYEKNHAFYRELV